MQLISTMHAALYKGCTCPSIIQTHMYTTKGCVYIHACECVCGCVSAQWGRVLELFPLSFLLVLDSVWGCYPCHSLVQTTAYSQQRRRKQPYSGHEDTCACEQPHMHTHTHTVKHTRTHIGTLTSNPFTHT